MAATHNYKHRERVPFKANSVLIHEVLISGYIQALIAALVGQVVISGGTANGTSLGENPGNLITRLVVEGASKGQYPGGYLRRITPRTSIRRRCLDYGWTYLDAALTGAAGTFQLNQPFRINFQQPRLARPIETSLKTDAYTGIQFRVETGGGNTQFTGNDRVFDFSGANVDVFDHREQMGGLTAATFEDDLIIVINAANPTFTFTDLPAGADYMDLLVFAETTNQQPSDGIINRAAVDFGQVGNYDFFQKELKEAQREFFYSAAQDTGLNGGPSQGLHYIPLVKDGLLNGAIPVRQNKQAKLLCDVSNPGGAGNDRLIVSSRRILTPAEMGLVQPAAK